MSVDAKSQNGDSNRRRVTRRHWIEKLFLVLALIGVMLSIALVIASHRLKYAGGFKYWNGFVRVEIFQPIEIVGPVLEKPEPFGTPGPPDWMNDLMFEHWDKPLRWLTTIEIRADKLTLFFGNFGSGFEWIPQFRFSRFGIYANSERLRKFYHGFLSLPVLAPMYLFAGLAGIIALRIFRRRMRIRGMKARNECLSCGYSLKGSPSGVCPECGECGHMPNSDPVTQTASKNSI